MLHLAPQRSRCLLQQSAYLGVDHIVQIAAYILLRLAFGVFTLSNNRLYGVGCNVGTTKLEFKAGFMR